MDVHGRERGPLTRYGFSKLLRAVANRAGIKNVHPHALRHACGHALAMKGRDMCFAAIKKEIRARSDNSRRHERY
jgi:site-specific recombinase XerD